MTDQLPADPREAFTPGQYYSITAVCKRLSVGRWTVQSAIDDKRLPAVRAGKRVALEARS